MKVCINPNLILRVWFASESSMSKLCIWKGAVALNYPSWVFRIIGGPPWSTLVGVSLLDGPWDVAVVGPLNKNVTLTIVLNFERHILRVHLEQRPVTEHWPPPIMRVQCLATGWLPAWCPPSRRGTLLLCKCRVSSDCQGRAGGAKGLTGWGRASWGGESDTQAGWAPVCETLGSSGDLLGYTSKCSLRRLLWSDEHVTEHFHFLLSLPVWTRIIKSSFLKKS